jgi:methyl-accepting chemotaxis protein
MSALRNIPIARKFALAFGLVCILCIALGTYTFFTFRSIAAKGAEVSENAFPSVLHLADARGAMNSVRRMDLDLLQCQNPACTDKYSAARQKAISSYQVAAKAYEPFISYPGERELYQKFSGTFAHYLESSDRTLSLLSDGKTGDALDLSMSDSTIAQFQDAVDAMNSDVELNAKAGTDTAEGAASASRRGTWIDVGVVLVIVCCCAVIGVVLTRIVAPRIGVASAALQRLAAKDLTAHVTVTGTDEIGELGDALNQCVSSLREVVQSVAQGAQTLSAASTEISARAVQSAGNANTQSSKTNQIAAAAQEMTATISEISHNAESAAGSSRSSAETPNKAGP